MSVSDASARLDKGKSDSSREKKFDIQVLIRSSEAEIVARIDRPF